MLLYAIVYYCILLYTIVYYCIPLYTIVYMYTILPSGELRRLLLRGRDPDVGRGGRQPRPLGHGRKEIRSKIFKNSTEQRILDTNARKQLS
jgi:hypothetical protein